MDAFWLQPNVNVNNYLYPHRSNRTIETHQYLWIMCCHLKPEGVHSHKGETDLALSMVSDHYHLGLNIPWLDIWELPLFCKDPSTSSGAKTWLLCLRACKPSKLLHLACMHQDLLSEVLHSQHFLGNKKRRIRRIKWKLAVMNFNLKLSISELHLKVWFSKLLLGRAAHSTAVPGCILLNSALHQRCTSNLFKQNCTRLLRTALHEPIPDPLPSPATF